MKMPGMKTGISINSATVTVHPEMFGGRQEQKVELTQEVLERMWKKMIEDKSSNPELVTLVADRKLEVKDGNNFNIKVNNTYFETQFRPFQTEVLNYLREKCQNQSIGCKVVVEMERRKQTLYMPREKYDAMKEKNPALMELRKLFEEIDF